MGSSLELCRNLLTFISPDGRSTRTHVGMALKNELGDQGYELWVEWSTKASEWGGEKDPSEIWKDFDPNSLTMSSIIFLAKLGGWDPSSKDGLLAITRSETILPKIPRNIFDPETEEYLELLAENQSNLPYEVAFCCLLGALSFAIGGNKVLEVREKWRAKGQLWLALVGKSGSGKTHIMDATGMDLLHRQQRLEREAARKDFEEATENSIEGAIPTEPAANRRLTADAITLEALFHHHSMPVNQAGFGVHADEILAVINGMDQYKGKGNDKQIWLKIFNHGTAEMTTVSVNRKIDSVFVPLLGGIQPDILEKLIGYEKQADGFAARFLMCHAERGAVLSVERRLELGRLLTEHSGSKQIEKVLSQLLKIRDQLASVKLSPEAQMHFLRYEKYLDDLSEEVAVAQHLAYGKLTTYIYRVALLLHYWSELSKDIISPDQTTLDLETAEQTTFVMEYFRLSMLHSYGIIQNPKDLQARQVLLDKVQELGKRATKEKLKQTLRNSFVKFGVSNQDGYRFVGNLIQELLENQVLDQVAAQNKSRPYLKIKRQPRNS